MRSIPTLRPSANRAGQITPAGRRPRRLASSAKRRQVLVLPAPRSPLRIMIFPDTGIYLQGSISPTATVSNPAMNALSNRLREELPG